MPPANKSPQTWTILSLLTWAAAYFKDHAIDSPRATAEILLAHALGRTRLDLYLNYDKPMVNEELAVFKILLKRRVAHEPVAFIVGSKEFYSLDFHVTPDVLIPRPETECLVERVLKIIDALGDRTPIKVLDVGTGSGAIIVSLAAERPGHHYFASDISLAALRVARGNAQRQAVNERINFFAGAYLAAVAGPFDLIVSNPPYIRSGDLDDLQPEIRHFEPRVALDGGIDGLAAYRRLIESAPRVLVPGGVLAMEIGWNQKQALQDLVAADRRYERSRFHPDYASKDRVACLHLKREAGDRSD